MVKKREDKLEEGAIKIREIQKGGYEQGEKYENLQVKNFLSLYGPGLAISDYNLGILYMLAVSSLATYGILLAGLNKDLIQLKFHKDR